MKKRNCITLQNLIISFLSPDLTSRPNTMLNRCGLMTQLILHDAKLIEDGCRKELENESSHLL